MKTQLLQDIQDSGAGPAAAPLHAAPPRASPSQPADAASNASPHMPDAAVRESPSAAADPTPAAGADAGATAALPDWLAERLREDAAQAERAERRTRWQRRAVGAGIAVGVLAVLAAGGLWLVQENRVDGALVVVANTTPTVAASVPYSAADADARHARSATVDPAAAPHVEPPPTMAPDVAQAASAGPSHVDALPPSRTSHAAASVAPATASPHPTRPAPRAHTADSAASTSRLRREETLMQCRAHGYDERQCRLRTCAMTRFGLACRG